MCVSSGIGGHVGKTRRRPLRFSICPSSHGDARLPGPRFRKLREPPNFSTPRQIDSDGARTHACSSDASRTAATRCQLAAHRRAQQLFGNQHDDLQVQCVMALPGEHERCGRVKQAPRRASSPPAREQRGSPRSPSARVQVQCVCLQGLQLSDHHATWLDVGAAAGHAEPQLMGQQSLEPSSLRGRCGMQPENTLLPLAASRRRDRQNTLLPSPPTALGRPIAWAL